MTPSVSPEADRELTEGGAFYAREGGRELGLAFIAEFERSLNFLCLHPHIGALWRNDKRRFSLRRFPYSIIYYLHDSELRVVAIAHHSQRPGYWGGRT
ncbi:MAG: type II toxin-antitoxin system RelE/ParE family toxin [Burkholderiales bacterium]